MKPETELEKLRAEVKTLRAMYDEKAMEHDHKKQWWLDATKDLNTTMETVKELESVIVELCKQTFGGKNNGNV
jgi:hypothetical protein